VQLKVALNENVYIFSSLQYLCSYQAFCLLAFYELKEPDETTGRQIYFVFRRNSLL